MFKENKKNFVWLLAQYLILMATAFITLKLNLDYFGQELFGYWILISSLWGFGIALDFGMGITLIRFVAKYKQGELSKLNSVVSSSFIVYCIIAVLILIIIYGIGEIAYIHQPNIIPATYKQEINIVFKLLGIAFFIRFVSIFFKSVLEGFNDFSGTSKYTITYSLTLLFFVIVVVVYQLSLVILALFYIISAVMLFSLYFIRVKKKYKFIRLDLSSFSRHTLKDVFKFSLTVQSVTMLGSFIDPLIKYLLGFHLGSSEVSYYEVARRFVISLTGLFDNTFRPLLTKISSILSIEERKEFFLTECLKISNAGIYYAGMMFGVLVIVFILLIKLIYGFEQSIVLFLVLALPEVVNKFGFAVYTFLMGIGKIIVLLLVQLNNLIMVFIILTITLIFWKSDIGLLGYLLSVLLGNFLMIVVTKKYFGLGLEQISNRIELKKLVLLLAMLLTTLILVSSLGSSIYIFIALSGLSVILFGRDLIILSKRIYNLYFGLV